MFAIVEVAGERDFVGVARVFVGSVEMDFGVSLTVGVSWPLSEPSWRASATDNPRAPPQLEHRTHDDDGEKK